MNTLIIIGAAPNAIDDLSQFVKINDKDCDYMAVGVDAVIYPINWQYVATGHKEDIPSIKSIVELNGCAPKIISYDPFPFVEVVEPLEGWEGGSSALLGTLAALKEGYTKIVLCGCPLEGPNHNHPGADYKMFQAKWDSLLDTLWPYIKSMSGHTKDIFGLPTVEWLNG
jgi:hypothetical protein